MKKKVLKNKYIYNPRGKMVLNIQFFVSTFNLPFELLASLTG